MEMGMQIIEMEMEPEMTEMRWRGQTEDKDGDKGRDIEIWRYKISPLGYVSPENPD